MMYNSLISFLNAVQPRARWVNCNCNAAFRATNLFRSCTAFAMNPFLPFRGWAIALITFHFDISPGECRYWMSGLANRWAFPDLTKLKGFHVVNE
ncbi:hypothetical protein CEXT_120221 [Caerostris extrusa]|uniref:Uncharacterized protein n=1 Tax=Caerostris extrusa TaxID=172846 RepID=A0AAV4XIF0_CAEEX|nr:hypothetical protein CEXT_120221 [Caerostris extrusa]